MPRIRLLVVTAVLVIVAAVPAARAEGAWVGAGTLVLPRSLHTLTALPDGSAVAVGGRGCPPARNLLSASFGVEVFDPVENAWRLGATPIAPRDRHTVTLLPDGRILMAGGQVTVGVCQARLHFAIAQAEIYDPASDRWGLAGSLTYTRSGHASTLLDDGRVLISGGTGAPVLEVWDPTSGTWAQAGLISRPVSSHSAVLLPDGRVLIAGGVDGASATGFAEVFDPDAGTAVPAGTMRDARAGHQAVAMQDGTVLVVGGRGPGGAALSSVESYDPILDAWTARAPTLTPRSYHTATLLADGRVLVVGGSDAFGQPLTGAELYDPATDTWTAAPATQVGHTSHAAARLADGSVLVVAGGYEGYGFTGVAERFTL